LGDGPRLRVYNSGWFNNHDHNHNIDKHHQHDTSRVHHNFFNDNFNIYINPSHNHDHSSVNNNHANDNNNVNDHHPNSNNDHNFCTIYTSSDDYD
jgi:hypothetical protein